MFCKHCGKNLPDDAQFCPQCGIAQEVTVNTQQPAYQPTPEPVFTAPLPENDPFLEQEDEEKDFQAGEVLKWGILGLAFSISGLLSLLGLIFSCVAKSKASAFIRDYGKVEGKAKVGRDLGTAGFIVGLVLTIFFVLYFALLIGIIAAGF